MNSYDDDPTYRGRSRSSRHGEDAYPGGRDPYEGYSEPTTRPMSGRASVGRASVGRDDEPSTGVGRASVGRASVSGSARPTSPAPEEPVYGAPYGDATYGAPYGDAAYGASSGASSGYGSSGPSGASGRGYDSEPISPPRGTAPVSPSRGSAPVSPSGGGTDPGRGVGRAQVRPISPSTPPPAGGPGGYGPGGRGPNGPHGPGGRPVPGAPGGDGPGGPGGHGPGGPGPGGGGPGGGPGGRGPGGRQPFRAFGLGGERRARKAGSNGGNGKGKLSRKARIRNIIIASVALLVMLSGGSFVGVTLFFDSIELGEELTLPETSTIHYSDGTLLARLGENTRYVVPFENMSPYVIEALIASEDEEFWTNKGVQFSAILRAAWNNITDSDTEGASTITQQYARAAFDLKGATYNRKIREAVYAWKMTDRYEKKDIIASYLNAVPFGRQTYGAEAAALAFFGKSVKKDAPADKQITRTEAMALVAMVKQPEPTPGNEEAEPGYDPTRGPEGSVMRQNAERNAKVRWEYVKGQLVELSKKDPEHFTLTDEEAKALEFPTTWLPAAQVVNDDLKKPAGLVERHVYDELIHTPGSRFENWSVDAIRSGGFQIVTTLDPRAQQAAENAADPRRPGSVMEGQPEDMQAALVAVEPGTGRVLAYYGGQDGSGSDYAGIYREEDGTWAGFGRYPPGSSFKIYVVAAALRAGYSINSYWQWTEHDQQGRNPNNPVRNASRCVPDWDNEKREAKSGLCSMLDMTVASLNVPFYDLTISVGPTAVMQMAYDAGIEHIWNDNRDRLDLKDLEGDLGNALYNHGINMEVGIGQYPVTVLDHANGVATFAAGGVRGDAHFVKEVSKDGEVLFGETLRSGPPVFGKEQSDLLNYTLNQVARLNINGFQAATKTGTWEYDQRVDQNAHAWNVGYTSTLAAAVWVGPKADEHRLVDKNGNDVWGSSVPQPIWEKFMRDATQAMGLDGQRMFNSPNFDVGNDLPPGAYPSPTPSPTPTTATTTSTRTNTNPPTGTSTTGTGTPTGSGTNSGGGGGGGGGGGDDDDDDDP